MYKVSKAEAVAMERSMNSGIVGLAHATSPDLARNILESGYLLTPPVIAQQQANKKIRSGISWNRVWTNFDQYPGVYMTPIMLRDLGADVYDFSRSGSVNFVFSIILLAQENYHINLFDRNGLITPDTIKPSDLDAHVGQFMMSETEPEMVFHNNVSLVCCEAIYTHHHSADLARELARHPRLPRHVSVRCPFVLQSVPYDRFCGDGQYHKDMLDNRKAFFVSVPSRNVRSGEWGKRFIGDLDFYKEMLRTHDKEFPDYVIDKVNRTETLDELGDYILGITGANHMENATVNKNRGPVNNRGRSAYHDVYFHTSGVPAELVITERQRPHTRKHERPHFSFRMKFYIVGRDIDGARAVLDRGYVPVHSDLVDAVYSNDLDMVKLLMRYGAPCNPDSPDDVSALGVAAYLDNYKITRHLLRCGAHITDNVMRFARRTRTINDTLTWLMLATNRNIPTSDRSMSRSTE
jgi:hypothetical protein